MSMVVSLPELKRDGGGGVLRADSRDWIVGFYKNLGVCLVEQAELWPMGCAARASNCLG